MAILRTLTAGALLALALVQAAPHAAAQDFPRKPMRIISVFPSGLSPDVAMRIVADKLAQQLGQPVIVEPRPGANGFIAIGALKKAAPDGHELLLLSLAHLALNPNLLKNIPYDPENDFVPVSPIYRAPFFIVVSATGPYRTFQDLIAAATANPQRITYGTPYVGSPPHLGGAMLAYLTGTQMQAVQFKENTQINTALVNGDIGFFVTTTGSVASLVRAGRLKILAIAAPARLASEPDVPTVKELGGPEGYEVDSWIGLVALRGTPPDVVRRINADLAKVLAEPDVKERFKGLGVEPISNTPAEMAGMIHAELKRYGDLIKRIGLTAE